MQENKAQNGFFFTNKKKRRKSEKKACGKWENPVDKCCLFFYIYFRRPR